MLCHEPRVQQRGLARLWKNVGQLTYNLVDDLLLRA